MSADPQSVMARIAVLQREIVAPVTGSAPVAFDNVPYTVSAADMPLFINFIGPLASNIEDGSDNKGREFLETRTYTMVLYTAPYMSGIEGEKLGELSAWFNVVYTQFMKWPHLRNLGGVVDSYISNDTGGSQTVQFNGQTYFGIRFTLQVTSRVRRLLGAGD